MTEKDQLIRKEFPILKNRNVIYLDNAATSQKPPCVIEAADQYYRMYNANPLRGLYALSVDATDAYENARKTVADFIGAARPEEIVFTRNASESLNLIAYSYARTFLKEGDEIICTIAEHHSNMLPWQQAAKVTGAKLTYLYCEKDGTLTPQMLEDIITERTKLVAVTQISNVFGRLNDIKGFAKVAHDHGAVLVADGAQSVPHVPVDVQDLDCDFLAFSGHKMFAPMGIGALYAKYDLLEKMPPFLYGGEMIEYVTTEGATYAEVPHKFEAGTVNVGGAVGLAEAIRFMQRFGWDLITKREEELTVYAMEKMKQYPYVHVIGSEDPKEHHGIITFKLDGVHPHDIAAVFDAHGIAVRAGHHCAQPLMKYLGTLSTTRASLAFYNNKEDIDAFVETLMQIRKEMGYAE
ncbi:cysteine desulfurase / selenocysteine lyase [Lachnospiraceae bacterium KHCPX20]|jgi:cysteine desulfurase/selenocysteine lyase|nr:cysteine desulfurase / selenocysteine lyase [Lachnospiraceae bacterium KHCPX20]